MNVFRTKPIPVIYSRLPFVRSSDACFLADCPEDVPLIRQLQSVAAGHACVSELEAPHELILKATFPDDIVGRSGNTGDVIKWGCIYWKLYDAESIITGAKPAEAVDPSSVGIDSHTLESLAHPSSCIPLLQKTSEVFRTGYSLSAERKASIESVERPIIAALQLISMKQLGTPRISGRRRPSPSANAPAVSKSLRMKIMRRDKHGCVFCGKSPPDVVIEVDHIIPRSLVSKLHLAQDLHTSPENLCVMCMDCNRGKSDHLAKEDVSFYIQIFSAASHPNQQIVQHLVGISKLQALK